MDEFEKIRAFSEEMSRQTEQAAAQEKAEVQVKQTDIPSHFNDAKKTESPNFLEEWSNEEKPQETSQKSLSKTFWIVLALASMVLVGLIFIFWLLLKSPAEKGEIITIPPTPTPVKIKPENPGGMVIPDQDKEIYSRLSKTNTTVKVEHLFDEEEETPVLPPVVVPEPELEPEPEDVIEAVEIQEAPVEVKEVPIKQVKSSKKVSTVKKKEAPKKEKTQKVKEKKKEGTVEKWHMQLFSSSDKAKVEATWTQILAKHKNLLSNMPMTIEKAQISGKGTFYRLKVGEFSTKSRAANLCSKLKKQHQDCLPVK